MRYFISLIVAVVALTTFASETTEPNWVPVMPVQVTFDAVTVDVKRNIVAEASRIYGIEIALIEAVIHVESHGKRGAISNKGAIGLMQLMPSTAKFLNIADPYNDYQNVMGGTKYLKKLKGRYYGNMRLALAAYNAGPGTIRKYGGIPPYSETANYVERVMAKYEQLNAVD